MLIVKNISPLYLLIDESLHTASLCLETFNCGPFNRNDPVKLENKELNMEESDRTRKRVNIRGKHYRCPIDGLSSSSRDISNVKIRTTVDLLDDGVATFIKHADLTGQGDIIDNCLSLHPERCLHGLFFFFSSFVIRFSFFVFCCCLWLHM